MAAASADPKRSKRALLDDSDSESEEGGAAVSQAGFKVNEEFARRFEHNKKREERQRLEEKFKNGAKGGGDDDDDSSSDEEEDEDGFLATEDLDAQISATLQAIRNKDPKVYDKTTTFFTPDDDANAEAQPKEKKEKPVYLKDYHREKYLRGDVGASDDEDDVPQTYNQEQDALKKSIVSEMHAAVDSDDSDEDGFMKRKAPAKTDSNGVHPSRSAAMKKKISDVDVTNADKDPENFLSNFMAARAWVPADGSNWKAFESDDGEDDDRADEIEHAYNMRFEDPEKSNEVLRSYARDVAASRSVRREEKTGRKRQRELEKERKAAEKRERQEEKARLRKLKLDEAEEKLRKIKHAAGAVGKELTDEDWMKFLDDAWEDDKWEEEMLKRFGDDYYAQEDEPPVSEGEDEENKKKKHPKKPKWDDDIDIKDIIPDFEDDEEKPAVSLSDVEDGERGGADLDQDDNASNSDSDSPPSKKRKVDHKKARKEAQKQARQQRSKLEALVDAKLGLTNHDLLSQPSSSAAAGPFRYRETSPQSFGLTARDILLAPSDAALNDFAGLKKLATFREEEKKRRDRKKLGKKARLRQWRRDVFGSEFERTGPTYGFEKLLGEEGAEEPVQQQRGKKERKSKARDEGGEEEAEEGNVVGDVGARKKKRKRSKGKKAGGVEA